MLVVQTNKQVERELIKLEKLATNDKEMIEL